jgi:hypothetical protein
MSAETTTTTTDASGRTTLEPSLDATAPASDAAIPHDRPPRASRPLTPLEQAVRDVFRRIGGPSTAAHPAGDVAIESLSAPAFRALIAERLRSLERDVAEIRSRINGLLFVVAGAVLSQIVLRLF